MTAQPEWWRGQEPPEAVPDDWGYGSDEWLTGSFDGDVEPYPPGDTGLRSMPFFRADVRNADIWLNDVNFSAAWSEFSDCRFRQRVRPVLNENGVAAQGSFGNRPSIYRRCTFERVRFKGLGGFSMMSARFEDCTFVSCRWEGHFAHEADLIDCTFSGRMNGCVWFGHSKAPHRGDGRRNIIRGNDFRHVTMTDNVGWRYDFPTDAQTWPEDYRPVGDVR